MTVTQCKLFTVNIYCSGSCSWLCGVVHLQYKELGGIKLNKPSADSVMVFRGQPRGNFSYQAFFCLFVQQVEAVSKLLWKCIAPLRLVFRLSLTFDMW